MPIVAYLKIFEVHSDLKWVDCDDSVKVNWTYNGSTFADYDTRTTAEKTAAEWNFVRTQRTKLLKASDWTQNADSPLTDSKKAEWVTYRQALRDISKQSDPFNITWPTEPS